MDIKQAETRRTHFRWVVGSVPVLVVSARGRWATVMENEGPGDVYVGLSGLTPTNGRGMLLSALSSLTDNYSKDDWWAVAGSSTGIVSGFELV